MVIKLVFRIFYLKVDLIRESLKSMPVSLYFPSALANTRRIRDHAWVSGIGPLPVGELCRGRREVEDGRWSERRGETAEPDSPT